ncbi:hypothetical protein [Nitratireductor luteus]|uniref:hypothetical protein n=1 Tax=Nitratireductor luteus TaxID=2976980 RepID=UPI00223FAE2F|nr:hypothetical protein [Nitratireductor luteus]
MSTLNQTTLFKPARPSATSKAETTTSVARGIIDAEAKAREAKSARLREARLAQEAAEAANPPAEPAKKKTVRKKPVARKAKTA